MVLTDQDIHFMTYLLTCLLAFLLTYPPTYSPNYLLTFLHTLLTYLLKLLALWPSSFHHSWVLETERPVNPAKPMICWCFSVSISVEGDFFVSGGGLSSRFRVGTISFHWGRCNASSDGSEHSLNGMKYPLEVNKHTASTHVSVIFVSTNERQLTCLFSALLQMQIYCYDPAFLSLEDAVRKGGRMAALAVLFEVGSQPDLEISLYFSTKTNC